MQSSTRAETPTLSPGNQQEPAEEPGAGGQASIDALTGAFVGCILQHLTECLIGSTFDWVLPLPLHYSAVFDKFIKHQKSSLFIFRRDYQSKPS